MAEDTAGKVAARPQARAGPVMGRLAARLAAALARLLARAPHDWPGFAAALATARAPDIAVLVEARHLPALALSWGEASRIALPPGETDDRLALTLEAIGAQVLRGGAGEEASGALVLPVADAEPGALLAALARPVAAGRRPMAVGVRSRTLGLEIAGGRLDLPVGRAHAGHDMPLAAAGSAAARALAAELLARRLAAPVTAGTEPPLPAPRRPLPLGLYELAMALATPVAPFYLRRRAARGKEDPERLGERMGRGQGARPLGRLVWVHAASVGESVAALPVVRALLERGMADHVLVTTGTATSARIMAQRLPEGASHQYVPLDAPRFVRRFLDRWRPDAALFVESELWPTMLDALARRDIPMAIVNGRMSKRSFARWARLPETARAMIGHTAACLAQSREQAARFARLGAPLVTHVGNLKFDAPPLPLAGADAEAERRALGLRPIWLAASTHAGEEEVVVEAHFAARDRFPDLLTIIVPRHPERGAAIAKAIEERWLVPARRSRGEAVSAKVDVVVADTLGELGLFYRIVEVVLVGGSFATAGGHNPVEPARLDCAILHGPNVENFADMYAAFDAAGGAIQVASAGELAARLVDLLADEERARAMAAANQAEIARHAGTLERTLARLAPLLA